MSTSLKIKISKEGIAPYFMKISEMRHQLEELGEVMSDRDMTTIVLNTLPKEWGNFTSSIYAKKEATNLLIVLDLPTCQGDIPGKKS